MSCYRVPAPALVLDGVPPTDDMLFPGLCCVPSCSSCQRRIRAWPTLCPEAAWRCCRLGPGPERQASSSEAVLLFLSQARLLPRSLFYVTPSVADLPTTPPFVRLSHLLCAFVSGAPPPSASLATAGMPPGICSPASPALGIGKCPHHREIHDPLFPRLLLFFPREELPH